MILDCYTELGFSLFGFLNALAGGAIGWYASRFWR